MPTPRPARPASTRSRPRRTTRRAAWSQGLTALCDKYGIPRDTIDTVFHGTTIATNAILEHDGAVTGMITTGGYRDILHIGRHQRPQHYSIMQDIPWQDRPLVKRRHRKTVTERLVPPSGEVLEPLDEEGVREAVRELKEAGVQAIAICFLFSYLDPAHEARAMEIVREEYPECFATTSSSVSPQFREFERFTTTAMNAFVGPKVRNYVTQARDRDRGIAASRPTCASWRRTAAWRRRRWWPSGRCSPCSPARRRA